MINKTIIQECILLEKQLSKYKLWGNLVPKKSFYANLRKVISKKDWDILRKLVYKKDSYKCYICGQTNIRFEAHEEWTYNYGEAIQKLDTINALCKLCHLNKHLGYASILIKKGELDENSLIQHWCMVNGVKKEKFREYSNQVIRLWNLKNTFDWTIVDFYGKIISKDTKIVQLLRDSDKLKSIEKLDDF